METLFRWYQYYYSNKNLQACYTSCRAHVARRHRRPEASSTTQMSEVCNLAYDPHCYYEPPLRVCLYEDWLESMTTMNWVKTVPGPMNVYFAAQWMTQTFLNLSWVGQTLSSNCPLIIINIERRLSLQSRKDRPMHFKTTLTGGFMWMNSLFF